MSTANGRPDILTVSGHYFNYLEPERSEFTIETIAYHLSNLCRFAGAPKPYYSVSQHSVLVSQLVPEHLALAGLLHDASEAFMVDLPGPLKHILCDSDNCYRAIERRVDAVVLARFGIKYPVDPLVKLADRVALFVEQRDLLPEHDDHWAELEGIDDIARSVSTIRALDQDEARELFLKRYRELVK